MSGNYQHILLYLKYNWSASGAHILPSKSIFITNYQIYSKLSRFSGKLLEIEFSPTHLRVQQSITKDILWVHFQKCLGEFLWSHAPWGLCTWVSTTYCHDTSIYVCTYAYACTRVYIFIYSFDICFHKIENVRYWYSSGQIRWVNTTKMNEWIHHSRNRFHKGTWKY